VAPYQYPNQLLQDCGSSLNPSGTVRDSTNGVASGWQLRDSCSRGIRRPEGADSLCDLLIFVSQPSGAITPSDPELVEIDHVVRPWTQGRGLVEGSVWAVPV